MNSRNATHASNPTPDVAHTPVIRNLTADARTRFNINSGLGRYNFGVEPSEFADIE